MPRAGEEETGGALRRVVELCSWIGCSVLPQGGSTHRGRGRGRGMRLWGRVAERRLQRRRWCWGGLGAVVAFFGPATKTPNGSCWGLDINPTILTSAPRRQR